LTTPSSARKSNLQPYCQNTTHPSFLGYVSPARLSITLLLAVTGYRFWFSTRLELLPDEAYY
jgi:hypothetical protein